MHRTRIFCCFTLSSLLYGIALQAGPAIPNATAFDRVTQHLDPGGSVYFYWSLEKILGQLAEALSTARDRALPPSLSPAEKEKIIAESDLVFQLIRSSGIEGLLAFGGSSKPVENKLYLTKAFAYAPQPSGFIWQVFSKAPHRFAALDFLPANTEAFGLSDLNLTALWQALLKDGAASQNQELVTALNEFARQIQATTGMTVDELLGSLGDEAGFVITLNQDAKVTIPLPNGTAEIPEPAGAIFWTVRDDRLFDRLDELFATNPATQKEDQPDLRIRVIPGAAPVEYFRPTLARMKNYLIVASNDKLVRSFAESLAGKAPTISSVAEFKELAKNVPDAGNMAQYISKRFEQTYYEALWRYMLANSSAKEAGVLNWEKTLYDLLKDWAAYSVTVREEDGLYFVKKETRDINDFLGQLLMAPAYILFDQATGSQPANSNDVDSTKKKPGDPER
jgi:chemotaxis regulatin CheY-phosphate phosphatase CheZ